MDEPSVTSTNLTLELFLTDLTHPQTSTWAGPEELAAEALGFQSLRSATVLM